MPEPAVVLLARCRYREHGGEDSAYEADVALLEANGHDVIRFEVGPVPDRGPHRRRLAEVLRRERPRVAHFHNTFPLLGPWAYEACRDAGVPIVQSLHNHRWECPALVFYRDGHECHDCQGRRVPWPGVWHACWRGSRVQTAASAVLTRRQRAAAHRLADVVVVPSRYTASIVGGVARPDAVHPDFAVPVRRAPEGPVFVGRASPEKGLALLPPSVRVVTGLGRGEVIAALDAASVLVVPSIAPESFGLAALEAFARGVPVIASDAGALPELVTDGVTGRLFPSGDAAALAAVLRDPGDLDAMGRAARALFDAEHAPPAAYRRLLEVYAMAAAT